MTRVIPLDKIGDYYRESIRILVAATTFEAERQIKRATPVDTGRLRAAWQSDPQKGEVTNNVEYAEPVVYGTNLPPSWKGEYRTRQNTVPGFPDLIAKELEPWVKREYNKIANR
ncbi:phage protein [uncultured Mediterranean phage uvMED]|nr:phage protein [uncultured Mediterranean phage uvMED]